MGDHFVLRSTLEAAIESKIPLLATEDIMSDASSQNMERDICLLKGKTVECRICHDEDEDCNMEIPCSCCGSLKYAHRRCIQRWCNEKGDTICEICHQQFKPGYTAPPLLYHCSGISLNFRGNWEIPRRGLHNPQFIAMVATDPNFLGTNFENYSPPFSTSLICCRVIAIIFMVLLVLCHTLPIIFTGAGEYSFTLFMLLLLRIIGILLHIYVMVKALTAIQRRRHQQVNNVDSHFSRSSSDEENEHQEQQPLAHHIHVR